MNDDGDNNNNGENIDLTIIKDTSANASTAELKLYYFY